MSNTVLIIVLWTATIGDMAEAGYSSPVVAGDRIYVTGNFEEHSTVFCLDAQSGKTLWTFRNGVAWTEMFAGTRSTPLLVGDFLYDESALGEIVCIEAKTGKALWQRNVLRDYETPNLLYGRSGSLRIDGDDLFTQLGGEKGSFLCLDKTTGKTRWLAESTGNAAGYGSPVLFEFEGRKLIAAMDAKGLFVLDRTTKKLQFHVRHPARLDENITTPICHDGKIFISNGAGSDSKLFKIYLDENKVAAEEVWTNRLLANAHQGVVVRNGFLYGATNKRGGGMACIRWNDGSDVFLDRNIVRGSLDLSKELFFILTEFGEIVIARPGEKRFDVITRYQLPGGEEGQAYAHPVVSGKRLFVRIGPTLHCLEIR